MILIIDENLPPSWVAFLETHQFTAHHWTQIGNVGDPDDCLWDYACANNGIILSQDLDFSRMLALRGTRLPSVIQLRLDSPLPEICGLDVVELLKTYSTRLQQGCLVVLYPHQHKIRLLPL